MGHPEAGIQVSSSSVDPPVGTASSYHQIAPADSSNSATQQIGVDCAACPHSCCKTGERFTCVEKASCAPWHIPIGGKATLAVNPGSCRCLSMDGGSAFGESCPLRYICGNNMECFDLNDRCEHSTIVSHSNGGSWTDEEGWPK